MADSSESRVRYSGLRVELDRLRQQFARSGGVRLFAQRYWGAGQLPESGWEAFARRAAQPQTWEEWHLLADGEGLIRFYGDHAALDDFNRMAESGWLTLAALERLPEPSLITLGADSDLCGWMSAVFETALAAMTPTLHLKYEQWGLDEDEVDDLNKFDSAYWFGEGDERHPAHPFVQSLTRDLFVSSAEAIGCWLDPDHVLTVDVRLDDLSIRLPSLERPCSNPSEQVERVPPAGADELSTRDAATFLKVSVDTLNAHVRAARLPRRNISPHGSSRGPFLYRVADLAKLRDSDYRRAVPRGQPKTVNKRKTAPPEPDYDDLDL